MPDPRDTPAMQQHARFKRQHPDCVLLFRIGDFYEMFDDDAVNVSKAIGLTLTQRTAGIPMAGMPHHQLDTYLRKLIHAGFRVAVCEQLEDASKSKGIVARGITRVITPGTLVDESLLEEGSPATVAAVSFCESGDESAAALAVIDLSTGAFHLSSGSQASVQADLIRRGVKELLYADHLNGQPPPRVKATMAGITLAAVPRPTWQFRTVEALDVLHKHFAVSTLAGFGLHQDDPALPAAGALLAFLIETQTAAASQTAPDAAGSTAASGLALRATLSHLRPPTRETDSGACILDAVSLRSLEIERTIRANTEEGSLLALFKGKQGFRTQMGRRQIREWLLRPLGNTAAIRSRQSAVAALAENRIMAGDLRDRLSGVQDVARIAGRLALDRATPRDLLGLADSLARASEIAACLTDAPHLVVQQQAIAQLVSTLQPLAACILDSIIASPPSHAREGGVFKDAIDAELDECRLLQRDSGAWIAKYQQDLMDRHRVPGLKVGFNKIAGYFIELPTAQARTAPPELVRRQTLKNAERFTTPDLAEFERKVMSAEGRAVERERQLFAALCIKAVALTDPIHRFGEAVATLDALLTFADNAIARAWVRPDIVDEAVLDIKAGRHPVLDESLGSAFVPNDLCLGGTCTETPAPPLALITGPNMAGKSTFIRQAALIAVLAHAGSFVPADSARIGVMDRIFTRLGADDALHAGQSTFMVEMIETANILNHVTPRSFVVLDEVGRGTSTLDGLSLAWAIVEHLAGGADSAPGPRTLFATHYHELTDLESTMPERLRNLHVVVREWPPGDPHAQIIFLHRIMPGKSDQSYGLHVARLAGIPASVVSRGNEVLATLQVHTNGSSHPPSPATHTDRKLHARKPATNGQLPLFTEFLPHPTLDALREIKLDTLTPLQAFDALRDLQQRSGA